MSRPILSPPGPRGDLPAAPVRRHVSTGFEPRQDAKGGSPTVRMAAAIVFGDRKKPWEGEGRLALLISE